MRNVLIALWVLFSPPLLAFTFDAGQIEIPDGFDGPTSKGMGNNTIVHAFTHPHSGEDSSALLQISIWNPGGTFPSMTGQQREEAAKSYLMQFLSGVARARRGFRHGDVEILSISGQPVARVAWQGEVDKGSAEGVMYCYLGRSQLVVLHTQDLTRFDRRYIDQAVQAFEAMKLR
ncbi:MAG: hypothetical protein R3175_08175 [Marinobacter sp.]|uniref:hypothetical protein n=1 Tax=Marinobacter sp. TaxID=50741 RepID=UPI00299DFA3E|nr:hypothetical protein [Marinobacter sp.]MDX1756017.1 hypothetical protein [Marinobacter sp.]